MAFTSISAVGNNFVQLQGKHSAEIIKKDSIIGAKGTKLGTDIITDEKPFGIGPNKRLSIKQPVSEVANFLDTLA